MIGKLAALALSSALVSVGTWPALPALACAQAKDQATPATPHARIPHDDRLLETGHYVDVDGLRVHSPAHTAPGVPPDGASAQCRDGSYSFSQHRRGTCSRHGGVARWL
jgi:hypothetical protein